MRHMCRVLAIISNLLCVDLLLEERELNSVIHTVFLFLHHLLVGSGGDGVLACCLFNSSTYFNVCYVT